MKNKDIFDIKRVLTKIQGSEIDDVDFAFELIELESKIDSEIAIIQKAVETTVKWNDKDKEIMLEQQRIRDLLNNPGTPQVDKQKAVEEFNNKFDEKEIFMFNDKNKIADKVLDRPNKKKYPKIDKDKLPKGLELSDYKVLYKISKNK